MLSHRWATYTSQRYALSVGDDLRNEGIRIAQRPNDFYLHGVLMRGNLGQFSIRIRRPDNSLVQASFENSNNIQQSASSFTNPLPIWPPIRYPFNSVLSFDLRDDDGAAPDNVTEIVFWGVHADPGAVPPLPSSPTRQLPYDLGTEAITIDPNSEFTVPLHLPFDSHALEVRQLLYSNDYNIDDPPEDVYFRLRDDNGDSFQNDWTNINALFNHEYQGWPGLVNPAPVIPPYGSFKLDLRETQGAGPFRVQFTLGGVLLDAR